MFKWLKIGNTGAASTPPSPTRTQAQQNGTERANLLRAEGNELLSQDRFAEAARCYEQALALHPADVASLVNIGFALSEMDQPEMARRHLARATAIEPSNHEAFFLLGMACERCGDMQAAADSFSKATLLSPGFEPARQALCRALFQAGQIDNALTAVEGAARLHPSQAWPQLFRGNLQLAAGKAAEAAVSYQLAVALAPHDASLRSALGAALQQEGRLEEAIDRYREALALQPDHAEVLSSLGNALRMLGRFAEAEEACRQAVSIAPDFAAAHSSLATVLVESGDATAALASFDRAIALQAGFTQALGNRGVALQALGRHEDALASFDAALTLEPGQTDALNNRGNTLLELGRPEDALASFDAALRSNAADAQALNNRGNALRALGRQDQALRSYEAALDIQPRHSQALNNIGNLLADLTRFDEAVAAYDRALAINPDYAESLVNRGNALRNLGRLAQAMDSYERALALKPGLPWLFGNWLHARMQACDWRELDAHFAQLARRIEAGQAFNPFTVLATNLPLAGQLQCARTYVQVRHPANTLPEPGKPRQARARIRLGYFSADFHEHATAWLMAELFELHDRTRFELIGFSFGPDTHGPMRTRLAAAFDQFHIVNARSDREVALLARELELDIAVDLKGYTQNSRPGIFALRPAPVQVNYLGYPGTMGAPFMDYIVADATVLPPEHQPFYTEKVATLPNSYQVNDSHREIAREVPTRAQAGLPDDAFVFCCFNNNYKITPDLFDVWMRLLHQVQGSVLWLLEGNPLAARNLRQEAAARGIDPSRLVFAGRAPLAAHLARHGLADLFLDTTWCNAHTTASDALWAGLPVLTLEGTTFAARVAASLNRATGMADMVVHDLPAYEALALRLASDGGALSELKARLTANRATHPLFDASLFARHIEAAYVTMWDRQARGLPPAHFTVPHAQV